VSSYHALSLYHTEQSIMHAAGDVTYTLNDTLKNFETVCKKCFSNSVTDSMLQRTGPLEILLLNHRLSVLGFEHEFHISNLDCALNQLKSVYTHIPILSIKPNLIAHPPPPNIGC
jgi:hypothetical protein